MMSRAVPETFKTALTEQLRELTSGEATLRYMELLEYDAASRDELRARWERRLRNSRAVGPDDAYAQALASAIAALRLTSPDEQLVSWSAKTNYGFIGGISTLLRPILILTSDHDHNPLTDDAMERTPKTPAVADLFPLDP